MKIIAAIPCILLAAILSSHAQTNDWATYSGALLTSSPAIDSTTNVFFGTEGSKVFNLKGTTGTTNWVRSVNGSVVASPLLTGSSLYVGTAAGRMYRFNTLTGTTNWTYDAKIGGDIGEIYSSAALVFGTAIVFTATSPNLIICLNPDGTEKWTNSVGGIFAKQVRIASSPAVRNGRVYVGSDDGASSSLKCYSATNGVLLWSSLIGGSIEASPSVSTNDVVYIGSYDNKLYAFNGLTGVTNWTYTAGNDIRSSAAVLANGNIMFGCDDEKVYSLTSAGALSWSTNLFQGAIVGSPALATSSRVYVTAFTGKLFELSSVTGAVNWEYPPAGWTGSIYTSPNIYAGRVFFGSDNGNLYSL